MTDHKTIIFNYYEADIRKSTPLGDVTLDRFITSIKYPKKKTLDIFEKIREASDRGDEETKAKLKLNLYSFTPCAYVKGRRQYKDIVRWTGLMALDFDKLPTVQYAQEWKVALFNEYKWIIAAWLSVSKRGVRALVKIPIVNSVDEFKEYFNAIQNELSTYRGWDRAPQNCILPLFLSYDPDLLERQDYKTWIGKYSPTPTRTTTVPYVLSDKSTQIERIIASGVDKIVDSGYIEIRSVAMALGGYVGGGQIDIGSAIQMIGKMIDCNDYMAKNPEKYKRVAESAIKKGMNSPLFVSDGR